MNFVAVNLAHDIITGRFTVSQAREEYARLYAAYRRGEKPAYTQRFQFKKGGQDTRDPDVVTLASAESRTEWRAGA